MSVFTSKELVTNHLCSRYVSPVDRIDQFAFYQLGQQLFPLTLERDEKPLAFDEFFLLWRAQMMFDRLLQGNPITLRVSRQPAIDANKSISDIVDKYYRGSDGSIEASGNDDGPVKSWEWRSVKRCIDSFETVFKEELRESATYRVPAKGIFDISKLVDEADMCFPPAVIEFVPSKAREEWKAAGRCLAFGLLSSSGFHVARAIEAMIEAYVKIFESKKKIPKAPNWGHYLEYLENVDEGVVKPDPRTVTEIRQMKDDWRNPLMHPRVVLDEGQARIIFSTGESLIISMATEIAVANKAKGGTGSAMDLLFGKSQPSAVAKALAKTPQG